MAPVKCEQCGKGFKNTLGLKIHAGIQHRAGRKARRGKARRRGFVCEVCGRRFAMAMHLARHSMAAHGRAARRGGTGLKPVLPVDVKGLSVDQLLATKHAVDARLADILRQMRSANVRL